MAFPQKSPTTRWTASDMPSLTGVTAIVTGANSGLGLETAAALARKGASVTMAVRSTSRGESAKADIEGRGLEPIMGTLNVAELDLADLASISAFADRWSKEHPEGLDLLVNNAGVMALPKATTSDGFEMQFGTNHLGHFALTGRLLPALVARPRSRVVTVSSQAHRMGRINLDDLMGEKRYRPWPAYGQSKLANLLFTARLQELLDLHGIRAAAHAAHPGFSATELQSQAGRAKGSRRGVSVSELGSRLFAQSARMGALPTLYACVVPGLPGNSYIGPDGFLEQRGHPRRVDRSAAAKDMAMARLLWERSEALTGVTYPF